MRVVVKHTIYGKTQVNTYEGVEMPTPKWVDYPALTLSTGERQFPFRIIDRDNIVSIDNAVVEHKITAEPVKKTIKVSGSKGSTYLVTINGKHKSCTCAGFQFRRSCKHVAEAA